MSPATFPVDRPLHWGILGPGRIAEEVMKDLALLPGGVLHAVGSRSIDRARNFADRHGAARAYGSYQELLGDDEVDVVYIATPHRQHHGIALAAIEAGKSLLVEKAFTCTLAGAEEVVAAARQAGVFVMEAMWTRLQPAVRRVVETQGWIEIPPRFHHPEHLILHTSTEGRSTEDRRAETLRSTGAGYAHELEEVHRCLAAGRTESAIMPLQDTLEVMAVLEEALHSLGVHPDEDPAPL